MSIVTRAILEARIGAEELVRLTDDSAAGTVDLTNLQAAIDEGEAEILGRLNAVYATPLALTAATTRAIVSKYALDCVRAALYRRRPGQVTEEMQAAHEAAVKWATQVAKGELGLAGETETAAGPEMAAGFVVIADERTVSRAKAQGL